MFQTILAVSLTRKAVVADRHNYADRHNPITYVTLLKTIIINKNKTTFFLTKSCFLILYLYFLLIYIAICITSSHPPLLYFSNSLYI